MCQQGKKEKTFFLKYMYIYKLLVDTTHMYGGYGYRVLWLCGISIVVLVPASETSGQYYVSQSAQKGRHRFLLGTAIGHICLHNVET